MLVLPARAKVNLALDVVRRCEDGFHDIDTIIAPIDWHDIVGIGLTPGGSRLTVTGDASGGVPATADDNTAARAAGLLSDLAAAGGVEAGFHVWLDKRVPAGAGLGGGSADAATVLRGGVRLLERAGLAVRAQDVAALAAQLGSDVPAALAARCVRVTGRGDHVQVLRVPMLHLVVVFLGASSTAATYAALSPDERHSEARIGRLVAALAENAAGMPPDDLLGSALEAAAVRTNPHLATQLQALRSLDPTQRWHMTGSGGVFFAVVASAAAGRRIAAAAAVAGLRARACRTLSGASQS